VDVKEHMVVKIGNKADVAFLIMFYKSTLFVPIATHGDFASMS
jgi:hypothetical protein